MVTCSNPLSLISISPECRHTHLQLVTQRKYSKKMYKNCNLDARKLLEGCTAEQEDNIKVNFKETGYKSVKWINLA